jgi:fatty acid kinase fatty acid binding subunit
MNKIAIVTDSTSDIPEQQAKELGISIVPAILILEGREYLDGESITREEYYDQLPTLSPPPTTSAPSSGMFAEIYKDLFQKGYDLICSVHAASTLSGIYNAARVAAEGSKDRVQVFDSGQITLGLGFQAIGAAKAAAEGSIDLVLEAIASIRRRVKVVAMLDTLEQLKRSGRVSWMRSSLGSLLRIKLFLEVQDGSVLRLGEARTRSKGILRLGEMLEELGPLESLAVVHTNALDDAARFAEQFRSLVPEMPMIRNVTTVIGTHVGVHGLGFVAVTAE